MIPPHIVSRFAHLFRFQDSEISPLTLAYMGTVTKLPSHAILSEAGRKVYQAATERGVYGLTTAERGWRDRYQALLSRGYRLRPRYHPDWTPSWLGTRRDPTFCEDSILLRDYHVIDAVRTADGARVVIKLVQGDQREDEIRIASALTTPDLLKDPANHCIPFLEAFPDTLESDGILMVMPYLHPFDSPPFGAVGEVVDFVKQTLEGLSFIHSQGVAHRDCAAANIMMDGSALYPEGHHPMRRDFSVDAIWPLTPLPRLDNPVKYYFIDFGISSRFQDGETRLVTGCEGRDKELPELSARVPYDPFKADIFILGNLYKKELLEKYHGVDFLWPLVSAMTKREPDSRPDARFALTFFTVLLENNYTRNMRWRIRPKDESIPERVVYDTVALARETLHQLKHIVGS